MGRLNLIRTGGFDKSIINFEEKKSGKGYRIVEKYIKRRGIFRVSTVWLDKI